VRLLKLILVVLVITVNLVFAPASLADPKTPKYTNNPDYIEVTQALNTLRTAKDAPDLAQTYTPEELQQKIERLEFQKYTLETGKTWGQCRNETGKTLAVYGPKRKKAVSDYENAVYFLADGQTTENKWDCDGVYLPNDIKLTESSSGSKQGQKLTGGVALKIVDGTQLVATTNPQTAAVEFNIPTAQVFKPGEINWFVPNVSQAYISTQLPNVPTEEND